MTWLPVLARKGSGVVMAMNCAGQHPSSCATPPTVSDFVPTIFPPCSRRIETPVSKLNSSVLNSCPEAQWLFLSD